MAPAPQALSKQPAPVEAAPGEGIAVGAEVRRYFKDLVVAVTWPASSRDLNSLG